ncbi:MAG: hypothetical protein EA361_11365 [Bacteroidetes bacterium]|nr:MAG: hypothetical protein EA361_11365 [Bacteroidota bacterium]
MFKKKVYFPIIFLFWALSAFTSENRSQGDNCRQYAPSYADSVADLLRKELTDRLPAVLLDWEHSCGLSEPLFRIRMLQLISEGQFPGYLSEKDMLDYAVAFDIRDAITARENLEEREEYYELYAGYFGYIPLNSGFDRQTERWASRMLARFSPEDPEWAWLSLYSGDTQSFFLILREDKYKGAELSEVYKERVAYFQKKPELNMGIGTGIWIPTADLEIIGMKPILEIFAGIKTQNTFYDLVFSMRFGQTKNPFELVARDSIVETRNYQGGFIGIEITRMFFKSGRYETGLYVSGGYDLMDIIEDRQDPVRETFAAAALQLGPVITYNFHNRSRISLKAGYSLMNHKSTGGSSLQGNAWNLRILFGFSDNARKTENLRRLGY